MIIFLSLGNYYMRICIIQDNMIISLYVLICPVHFDECVIPGIAIVARNK